MQEEDGYNAESDLEVGAVARTHIYNFSICDVTVEARYQRIFGIIWEGEATCFVVREWHPKTQLANVESANIESASAESANAQNQQVSNQQM